MNRKVTIEDKKHGIEYSFDCPRLKECLAGEDLQEVAYTIKSSNGKTSKTFKSQREATIEMLKFLALAHECLPETKTDSEGNQTIFYGGPSPDEVTLVDFSKNQGVVFCETSETYSKLRYDSTVFPNESGEVEYKVYERMLFNSDRKRMSILIKDPKDGLYKLYTKGADSIILARLDQN